MTGHPGRIVRIRTFNDAGAYSDELWWAVIDDDAQAVKSVMNAAKTLADQGVEALGRLDPRDIHAHGLAAGFVGPAKA